MGEKGGIHLVININDLQRLAPNRHKALLKAAQKEVISLGDAVKEKISITPGLCHWEGVQGSRY